MLAVVGNHLALMKHEGSVVRYCPTVRLISLGRSTNHNRNFTQPIRNQDAGEFFNRSLGCSYEGIPRNQVFNGVTGD